MSAFKEMYENKKVSVNQRQNERQEVKPNENEKENEEDETENFLFSSVKNIFKKVCLTIVDAIKWSLAGYAVKWLVVLVLSIIAVLVLTYSHFTRSWAFHIADRKADTAYFKTICINPHTRLETKRDWECDEIEWKMWWWPSTLALFDTLNLYVPCGKRGCIELVKELGNSWTVSFILSIVIFGFLGILFWGFLILRYFKFNKLTKYSTMPTLRNGKTVSGESSSFFRKN